MIQIAIMGLGTVGTGVAKVVAENARQIERKLGEPLQVKAILVRHFKDGPYRQLMTDDFTKIEEDDAIRVVVETIGGVEAAYEYTKRALNAGKHVVTANKQLVAEKGCELLALAKKRGVNYLFEASVGGGIPVLHPLTQCMAANRIDEVYGILNGTTNYILTRMVRAGATFADALREAQEKGYAEADPTADVEGYDAARKVAIMASIAFNSRVTFSDVYTQGITKITAADIAYATEMGMVIKLLGVARNTDTGIEAGVYPMLIPADHPLAGVNDSFNAVFVHGDAVDDAMFQGRGAGKLPTGSAVAGDIFEVARDIMAGSTGRINCTCYKDLRIKPVDEVRNRYFIRMEVEDRPGVLAAIASVFGNNHVSISQVIQKSVGGGTAELVIITDQVEERHFKDALLVMNEMSIVKEIPSVLRVYAQSE